MNKMKKGLLVGFTVFIIGAVIFVVSMSVLNWDFYKLDAVEYTERTFLAADNAEGEEITRAEINVSSFKLEITRGDEIKLNYYEASDSVVSVSVEDGVLKINERRKNGSFVYGMFKLGRLKYKYALTLPDGVAVNVESVNGDVSLAGIVTDSVKITSTNCNVTLSDCKAGTVFVDSTNADVGIFNSECGKTEIFATNLDFIVKNSSFTDVTVMSTNTDIEMYGAAAESASFTATNADLKLEKIAANRIGIDGTNVDAYVSVLGVKSEYTIDAHGWGDLPDNQTGSDANKKITVRGTNTDVDLRFVA